MDELVQRLTVDQPVVMGGSDPTVEELRNRTGEMGYVLVKFTETRGGTELGFPLDRDATDLSGADFDNATGTVHVEGLLILNDDPVRLIADIDLATLKGTGRLALDERAEAVVE
jgi:Core binding factor beta subunit